MDVLDTYTLEDLMIDKPELADIFENARVSELSR